MVIISVCVASLGYRASRGGSRHVQGVQDVNDIFRYYYTIHLDILEALVCWRSSHVYGQMKIRLHI